MNILVLSCQDPHELANGIGSIAHNSLRCLLELGHHLQTVCIVDEKDPARSVAYAQEGAEALRGLEVTRISRGIDPKKDALRALTGGFLNPGERRFRAEIRQRSGEFDLAIWFGHLWDPLTRTVLTASQCPVILHVNDSITLVRRQRAGGMPGRLQIALAEFLESSIIGRMGQSRAAIVYVGEEDRRSALGMAKAPNASVVFCLPLAVDTETFSPADANGSAPQSEGATNRMPVILFTGHMGYGPNVAAATRLVRGVLPLLPRDLKVRLAGKSPAEDVLTLACLDRRVCVTGEVHDIVAEYQRADIFLAPIAFSYGMKTKVLEAMACGLPVVASPGAASGFDGIPPGVIVGRTDEELAALTVELLRDEGLRRRTGAAGRRHVVEHHRWIDRTRKLTQLLNARPEVVN